MNLLRGRLMTVSENLRQILRSPGCGWVVTVMAIAQTAVSFHGGPVRSEVWDWYQVLGLSADGMRHGRVWQLFTHSLLHGDFWHFLLNVLFVLLVGSRVEHMAGRGALGAGVIFGVLGGAVAHLLLADRSEGAPILVGFSGGCLSLLLMLTTLSPQSRMMPLPVSARSLGAGVLVSALFLALMHPSAGVPGFGDAGKWLVAHGHRKWLEMAHACHFGGGLAGWLTGRWILRPRVTLKRLRAERERREALIKVKETRS